MRKRVGQKLHGYSSLHIVLTGLVVRNKRKVLRALSGAPAAPSLSAKSLIYLGSAFQQSTSSRSGKQFFSAQAPLSAYSKDSARGRADATGSLDTNDTSCVK